MTESFSIIDEILADTPKQKLRFVDLSCYIAYQIRLRLKEKEWKQIDLANAMGKKESEISRYLSGLHNFTLRTIAHIETVLEFELIIIIKEDRK